MTDIEVFFTSVAHRIDTVLDQLLPGGDVEPKRLHDAVRWSVFGGGKRFRPALVLAVGSIFGSTEEKLLRTAAAMEMIHTYSLIHDDLPSMDDDDMRRGRETCHKKFDEATAILAGDLLQTLAFKSIAEDELLSSEVRLRLVSEVANAAGSPRGMIAGQQMDLDAQGAALSHSEIEHIHSLKTGALITMSARAGAIIGEASEPDTELVTSIGSKLGLLFQITDDLLDVTQSTEMLGKTAGKDAASGKATYPAHYGIDGAREKASEIHERILSLAHGLNDKSSLIADISKFILDRTF
jgi:geranylgeranyl pyrophosphate synthase